MWHITRRLTISRLEEASLFSCSSEQACESCSQPKSTWTLNPYPSYSSPNAYELTQPSWWDGTGPLEFLVQDLTKMKEKKPLKTHKNQTSTFQNRDDILYNSICTITFTCMKDPQTRDPLICEKITTKYQLFERIFCLKLESNDKCYIHFNSQTQQVIKKSIDS